MSIKAFEKYARTFWTFWYSRISFGLIGWRWWNNQRNFRNLNALIEVFKHNFVLTTLLTMNCDAGFAPLLIVTYFVTSHSGNKFKTFSMLIFSSSAISDQLERNDGKNVSITWKAEDINVETNYFFLKFLKLRCLAHHLSSSFIFHFSSSVFLQH